MTGNPSIPGHHDPRPPWLFRTCAVCARLFEGSHCVACYPGEGVIYPREPIGNSQ